MWELVSTSNDDFNNNNPNNDQDQQTDNNPNNDQDQQTEDYSPSVIEADEDENDNNYVESDELNNEAEMQDSAEHNEVRQLSNHGGARQSANHGGARQSANHGGARQSANHGGARQSANHGGARQSANHGGARQSSNHGGARQSSNHGGAMQSSNHQRVMRLFNHEGVRRLSNHSEVRQLSNHSSPDDVITRGQPLAFSSLCEKFNKTQLFVLEYHGLTTYDDDVIMCKKCKYKLWCKIPFWEIITSHYAMSREFEALHLPTKYDTGEFDARCYLAKTLGRCLPTYTNFINMSNNYIQSRTYEYDNNISQSSSASPSDQSRASSVFNQSNSVIINQSRAIALAGCGFSFDRICNSFYCDRCKIVASKDLSFSNVSNILDWHAKKERFCPFIVGLKNLDKNENVDNDGMLVFKGYEDYLMDVTTVDHDGSRYER